MPDEFIEVPLPEGDDWPEGAPMRVKRTSPDRTRTYKSGLPPTYGLSRDGEWESRRPFHEAVLATGERPHPLRERAAAVASEEVEAALREGAGGVGWETWSPAFQRIARRIVLGDSARDDDELTAQLARMMDEANSLPDGPSEELGPYLDRVQRYVDAAEAGSLVSRFASAPADERPRPCAR